MRKDRIGETNVNNQGCLMKIVEYKNSDDIIIEFQDEYKSKVSSNYYHFLSGDIKNPYHPTICNIGKVGNKYPSRINTIRLKEYSAWVNMIKRCYDIKFKTKHPTYKDVACCKEWLLYENFYEWLHKQENFDKWLNGDRWNIDKDILAKGNRIYSPETCCLVPQNVNCLFTKNDSYRGDLPIGITKIKDKYQIRCCNPLKDNGYEYLGRCIIPKQGFMIYKKRKEEIIKQVAELEYNNGNIVEQCYEAMMNYQVEITD